MTAPTDAAAERPPLGPLPCGRWKCIGEACGNFNRPEDKFGNPRLPRGCKGGEHPPWSWARDYNRGQLGNPRD